MSQRRDEAIAAQRPQGALLGNIKYDRPLGAVADKRHHTVLAGLSALHYAPVTVDGEIWHGRQRAMGVGRPGGAIS